MSDRANQVASTTLASAAAAQSRAAGAPYEQPGDPLRPEEGEGSLFLIGSRVDRAVRARPYERKPEDPVYRPLRIFTLDPSVSRLHGSTAVVNVPYEPLQPGPVGSLLKVDNRDGGCDQAYVPVDLEAPFALMRQGRDPSPSDPQFHQQMAYAVCSLVYVAFRGALGRDLGWGYERDAGPTPGHLIVRPHACNAQNAFYDRNKGELCFGYFEANADPSHAHLPRGTVFTCLSHDVIAHEMTHALLDGLRSHFAVPTGPDVLAFHEAFADLVAIFQHFSYKEVVHSAIRRSRGEIRDAWSLTELALQFGQTTGKERGLRSAVQVVRPDERAQQYRDAGQEPHELGSVLVSAVFAAFLTVFGRKTERYIRLATGGTGVLPKEGELSADLQAVLAEEASQLASQFLTICIRAVDYCPPVDLDFGEFLRAVVTADHDLVPDDPHGYREAWIDAFRARGIFPGGVKSLSEDELLWRQPVRQVRPIEALTFAELRFEGDPGRPAGLKELRRQAGALGREVAKPEHLDLFGLARQGDPRLDGDAVDPPKVESIRSSRRVGPDGQVVFDLVAEVTQRRIVKATGDQPSFDFFGGATVILGPKGNVRYVVSKSILNGTRLEGQRRFIFGSSGKRFWQVANGRTAPAPSPFQLLHRSPEPSRAPLST